MTFYKKLIFQENRDPWPLQKATMKERNQDNLDNLPGNQVLANNTVSLPNPVNPVLSLCAKGKFFFP